MFKWLFQWKRKELERLEAKRLKEEEIRLETLEEVRERVKYLFQYRTKNNGEYFTFADLEAATIAQNPVRQVSVAWLNELSQDTADITGCLGKLFAISDFFGVPTGFNFWFGYFTEELKTEIRVINNFIIGRWQKVFDTESVVLQPVDLITLSDEHQVKLYRETLDSFINSADFKSTLAKNLLLWLEDSFLVLCLSPNKTYKVLGEVESLEEKSFHFNDERINEFKYLLKEGWDFEWKTSQTEKNPTINLSLSVPDKITLEQVKQGGPYFVQQLLNDQPTINWLSEHLIKRLDHLLGFRTPDPSVIDRN